MKKFILACTAAATLLTTAANADFTRVEMGTGVWSQTPNGYISRDDNDGIFNLNGTYTSAQKNSTEFYIWAFIKHPLPLIPNLRLEYVTIADEGETTGSVDGLSIPGSAPTTIDMVQYDIIPYYNLLDNTFWMTIDVGIDIKIIESDVVVGAVSSTIPGIEDFPGYSSTDTTIVPFLYLRDRIEIPASSIALEADAKYITDGTNTLYDVRAKLDYSFDYMFDIKMLVEPALEIGYRAQKVRIDDGATQVDIDYSGLYFGLMLRF